MKPLIYGRLVLAVALPLLVAGVLGLTGWHAWQQQQTALATRQAAEAAITVLRARQAEYQPGGAGYQRYNELLNSGFATPASPAELRSVIKKLARQQGVTLQGMDIGAAVSETEPNAGLTLLHQMVVVTASAASDTALFAFIDALRRNGHAELALDTLAVKSAAGGITADLTFGWSSLSGAPQLEYTETPIALADPLAAGKALFANPASPVPATVEAAPMLLKVEDAGHE